MEWSINTTKRGARRNSAKHKLSLLYGANQPFSFQHGWATGSNSCQPLSTGQLLCWPSPGWQFTAATNLLCAPRHGSSTGRQAIVLVPRSNSHVVRVCRAEWLLKKEVSKWNDNGLWCISDAMTQLFTSFSHRLFERKPRQPLYAFLYTCRILKWFHAVFSRYFYCDN